MPRPSTFSRFTVGALPLGCWLATSMGACEFDNGAVFRPPADDGEETGSAAANDDDDDESGESGVVSRGDEGPSSSSSSSTTSGSTSTTGFGTTTTTGGTTTSGVGTTTSEPPPTFEPQIIEAETATISGPYAGMVTTPFAGVGLFANDDTVSTTVTFPQVPGAYEISVTGASSGTAAATAQVQIGTRAGSPLTFTGTAPQVRTITLMLQTGDPATQTLGIVVTSDDGTWDLFVDKFEITWSGP